MRGFLLLGYGMTFRLLLFCLGFLCTAFVAQADEPKQRHGVIIDGDEAIQVVGGFTTTAQSSSDSRIHAEMLSSFDLVATVRNGAGKWTAYVEGNLSPRVNGISSLISEANADAGTALDRDGKGRLQVSELHYSRRFGESSMTIGLLNPSCQLDASDVANDETSQFLNTSFVNNPTIAFPDYTLGTCLHLERAESQTGMNLLLSSSHGLANNPDASYSGLFDVSAEGKGIFFGVELYRESERSMWRLGMWLSTADADYLDGSGNRGHNHGVYLTSDHVLGEYMLNTRVGLANDEVSEAANFIGLALETVLAGGTLGLGIAQTGASANAGPGRGDTRQAELYYRVTIGDGLRVTPSLQWIQNSGFDNTGATHDTNLVIYGLRITYLFR